MRGSTLESMFKEMGVLRSFSRPMVSNDNPYSESLLCTVKYRSDNPRRPSQANQVTVTQRRTVEWLSPVASAICCWLQPCHLRRWIRSSVDLTRRQVSPRRRLDEIHLCGG